MSVCVSQFLLDLRNLAMTILDPPTLRGKMIRPNLLVMMAAIGLVATATSSAFAQSRSQPSACRDAASLACQNTLVDAANAAFENADSDVAKLHETERLLVDLLKRPDMARPTSEARRAHLLQRLAHVRFPLQDLTGSKEAGRQALAIWERRADPAENADRWNTQINLVNVLTASKDFGEAETLALQLLAELGPARADTDFLRTTALELMANLLDGQLGPIDERIRRRSEIVARYRAEPVQVNTIGDQRRNLARALGNLANAQTDADALEPASASLREADALMRSILMEDSNQELVLLRQRWLTLLVRSMDRCGAEAVAVPLLPYAEQFGNRILSQVLIQHGENYRLYGASSKAAPLWSRATALELAMACPAQAGRSAADCTGSPLLIDHLRSVGMALKYNGQGRASAGYRGLVQAGDILRARTLGGFALNRDASNAYTASRDIFRDQITTAWAINDPSAAPKVEEAPWTCPLR